MLQSGDSDSGQSNTEANALVHHQAWLPLASPPIPKAWARLLGPALLPCSLAPQGLCLSRPLEASLSTSSSPRAPSHSVSSPAGHSVLAAGAGQGEPAMWELQVLSCQGLLCLP